MNNSTIKPAPPSLAGLIWRPIARDDLAALVDLAGACHSADGGLAFMVQPDHLIERYFPESSGAAIGAFSAGEHLVACAAVYLTGESGTLRAVILGQVRPDLRNRGIGTYLMRWSQVQARSLLTAARVDRGLLRVLTESLTESANRLYLVHGFKSVDEQLVMRRDLSLPVPDRPLPSDVTVTSWQPALANQFFQAYEAAFRERPGFPGLSAGEWITQKTDENFKPEWSLLARAGDVPVGFLIGGIDPPGGFVVQVGVIPAQRRRGLASALMVETMRRMQAAGADSAQLTVNLNNPGAIQAYDRLDFATIGRRARYEKIVER